MGRRLARQKALQALYQVELQEVQPLVAISDSLSMDESTENVQAQDADYINKLVFGIIEKKESIDELITDTANNWNIDRISIVDKNILRIAIYEMIFMEEQIPGNVAINEAVDLAKAFSNDKAAKFINGILDNVKNRT